MYYKDEEALTNIFRIRPSGPKNNIIKDTCIKQMFKSKWLGYIHLSISVIDSLKL